MDYFNLVLSNLSCGFHCRYITQWTFLKEILLKLYSEAYLDPYQKSTEEYFVKIGNGFQLLAIFTGNFILDVWRVLNTPLVLSLEFTLKKVPKPLGANIKQMSQIDVMMSRTPFFWKLLHLFYHVSFNMSPRIMTWNYNTRNTIFFSVSKISFIYLITCIDSTNDQNTMCGVI